MYLHGYDNDVFVDVVIFRRGSQWKHIKRQLSNVASAHAPI